MNSLKGRIIPQIKFHSVNIYVSDLDRALFYYRRLGFEMVNVSACYTAITVRLPQGNCPDICLKYAYEYDRKPGEITIGIAADDDQGVTHEDVFLDLLYRGFVYSNVEADFMYGDTIFDLGVLTETDGVQLELANKYSPINQ